MRMMRSRSKTPFARHDISTKRSSGDSALSPSVSLNLVYYYSTAPNSVRTKARTAESGCRAAGGESNSTHSLTSQTPPSYSAGRCVLPR